MTQLSLEDKVGQMLAAGFHGLTAPQQLLDWLAQGRIGAVILFARNVESPQQLAALTRSLHHASKHPLLIGIDQEGGTVARLRQGFTEGPGAMALAAIRDHAAAATREVYLVMGRELQALGINWNYAPVVDLFHNAHNPTLGTRTFGSNVGRVSELAAAAVEGLQTAHVAACAKHFPGLGNTAVDTHKALAVLSTPLEQLIATDLEPYRAAKLAGLASIMTTHTIFNTLDPDLPATLSPVVINRLLRGELGFEGVVTTDCMEMKAISDHYGPGESAVLAALAGVDVILFSHTDTLQASAYDALLAAVQSGRVPEALVDAAVSRVMALRQCYAVSEGDLSVIRQPQHLAVVEKTARAGTVLVRGALPVDLTANTVLVEFASVLESDVVERGEQTGLAKLAVRSIPNVKTYSLRTNAEQTQPFLDAVEAAAQADTLILATRNACWLPDQMKQAQALVQAAKRTVLVALRSPFDAVELAGAAVVLSTLGDSTPSLLAALAALMGEFVPDGELPVQLEAFSS